MPRLPSRPPSPHYPLCLPSARSGKETTPNYFTNVGLAEAETTTHSVDSEALALTRDEGGLHSFIPIASAKAKDNVVQDKTSPGPNSTKQSPHAASHEENGWDDDRIQSHLRFWMALSVHEYRHGLDEYGNANLPVLCLYGTEDATCHPVAVQNMEEFVDKLEVVPIPAVGHWVMLEAPQTVTGVIVRWLGSAVRPTVSAGL